MLTLATIAALAAPPEYVSTSWGDINYWDMLAFCTADHVVVAQVEDLAPSYNWRPYWFGTSEQDSIVTTMYMKVLGEVRGQAPSGITFDIPGGRFGNVRSFPAVRPTKYPYPEHKQTFFFAYSLAPEGLETHDAGEIVSLAAFPIGVDPEEYGWTMNDVLAEAAYLEGKHCE